MEFINENQPAKIKVIGVGGCGGNLVRYMNDRSIFGVQFVAVNTDTQALNQIPGDITCLHIGGDKTRGLGAGANPQAGSDAAKAETQRLRDLVRGLDMVFITAGMGKGTGTGASPVIAKIAREEGVLTVAVVTMPLDFERRTARAEEGLKELSRYTDSVIIVPNNKLMEILDKSTTMRDAFTAANEVLYNAVRGVSDIINCPGMMNVDFNDVRTTMQDKGKAVIGSATANGEDRAIQGTQAALHSPLIEDIDLSQAGNILVNVTAHEESFTLEEYGIITKTVGETVHDFRGEIFSGVVNDNNMEKDEIRVTIIVTGLSDRYQPTPSVIEGKQASLDQSGTPFSGGGQGKDAIITSGRRQKNLENLLEENDNNEKKIPTILRQQIS